MKFSLFFAALHTLMILIIKLIYNYLIFKNLQGKAAFPKNLQNLAVTLYYVPVEYLGVIDKLTLDSFELMILRIIFNNETKN